MTQLTRGTATYEADREVSFDIRRARREDMPAIAGFVRSSADWYREIVSEDDMSEHDVDETWEDENYRQRDFYIGSVDGEPVGTISLQYFGDCAYLGYIYLDVKHVGKGYGHQLMNFAEDVAKKRGMRQLALIAHPDATWAKRAYLKYGFDIVETEEKRVKAWKDGALEPYYENGFQLYLYDLAPSRPSRSPRTEEVMNAQRA
jgi:GNAT superfamily N-acetyltransferase